MTKAQIVHGSFCPFKSARLFTMLYYWLDYRPGESLGVSFSFMQCCYTALSLGRAHDSIGL